LQGLQEGLRFTPSRRRRGQTVRPLAMNGEMVTKGGPEHASKQAPWTDLQKMLDGGE